MWCGLSLMILPVVVGLFKIDFCAVFLLVDNHFTKQALSVIR